MNNINIQLELLLEVLGKKISLMEEIKTLTEDQKRLLENESFDFDTFNKLMNHKQIGIDKIIDLDEGFQITFSNIRSSIEAQPKLYKTKIEQMKEYIKRIGELGITITVQEERNKTKFAEKSIQEKNKVKEFRVNKKNVANYYANINRQQGSDQAHFFDSKK